MSKPRTSAFVTGIVAATGLLSLPMVATAADLLPLQANCGPCGCLEVSYVYHRQLESTYGVGFDPRSFDATEPYYYWGRVRAYPRYRVVVEAAQ
jgi:hypothetical protein